MEAFLPILDTNEDDIICISYPKSGRTWLRVMLNSLGVHPLFTHYGSGNTRQEWGRHWSEFDFDPLRKMQGKIIFLYRDPRDTAVSFYFECTKRQKRKRKHIIRHFFEGRNTAKPIDKFVLSPRFGVPKIIKFNLSVADALFQNPNVIMTAYEDMVQDTPLFLTRILGFIGESRSRPEVLDVVDRCSFTNMQKEERAGILSAHYGVILRPGDDADTDSYKVRRGVIGGYLDELKSATAAQLSDIMAASNYHHKMAKYQRRNNEILEQFDTA